MLSIKFMFDYGADSCLWGTQGEGLLSMERFPISKALLERLQSLSAEYNFILNWEDPASGFVWTPEQIEDFRVRAQQAYADVVSELGEQYQIQNGIPLSLGLKNG